MSYNIPKNLLDINSSNILELKNSTNAQEFRLYSTDDGAGNAEFLSVHIDSDDFCLVPEATGTGTVRELYLGSPTTSITTKWHGILQVHDSNSGLFMGQATLDFSDVGGFRYNPGTPNRLETVERFSSGLPKQWWVTADSTHRFFGDGTTDPAEIHFYNTYTDESNYERLEVKWDANVASIRPVAAGTGTVRQLVVQSDRLENQEGYSYIRVSAGTSGRINVWRDMQPQVDGSSDLGQPTLRWAKTCTKGLLTGVETFTTASDTLDDQNQVCLCNATSGNITLNLPVASSSIAGTQYQIKKIDSSSNTVIITPNSGAGDLIDGSATYTLSNQWEGAIIVCDGADWFITGGVTNSGGGGGGGGGLGGGD